jgi:hypothetical protein
MQGPFLRKYGAATTVNFQLYETDGVDLKTDAVHAAGDTKIMKDEGAEANTTNGFTDEGQGYSLALTATEMEAARIVVYVVDQTATKVWLDTAIVIETYGNASAQHAIDLDDSVRAGLTALPNANADAAGGLPISDAGGLDLDTQLGTDIDAILADTNELQGDWTNTGRLDTIIDAIKAKTDNLPADPADDSDIDAQLATIDTVVDAIKAVTDNLPDSGSLSDLATILADTNELQGDWTNGGRLDLLIDAIKAKTDNLPADPADDSDIDAQLATIDTVVDAIKAKTDNLPADPADDSDIDSQLSTIDAAIAALNDPTAAAIADAVWDETNGDHLTAGTTGKALNDASSLGSGAITFTYTLTSSVDGTAIESAQVWVTTDIAGTNVIASGYTNASGQVTFYLDAGTYYVWRQKSGWNFSNPDTETVS